MASFFPKGLVFQHRCCPEMVPVGFSDLEERLPPGGGGALLTEVDKAVVNTLSRHRGGLGAGSS